MRPPPPAFSEVEGSPFYDEVKEVYDLFVSLTPEQRATADYWADDPRRTSTPPGHWILIAHGLTSQQGLTGIEAAELYALLGASLGDAFISTWREKYRSNYMRPISCVRDLFDAEWLSHVRTPPFPEYTSGHSVGSGAAAVVLTNRLGALSFTDNTHAARNVPSRTYASFDEAAQEAALSRLYGGIHFRQAVVNGLAQGRCIGQATATRLHTRR